MEYIFTALLECERCGEAISCCGDGFEEPYEYVDNNGEPRQNLDLAFKPRFFCPHLNLLRLPRQCPLPARDQLHKSFAVFFCDLSAAANHLRQCLEEILTHAGIEARNADGNFISLERRIRVFEQTDRDNADRADALRLIGNIGSHPEEALAKNELFDAYDILEVLLEDLYVGHLRNVREMVERIRAGRPRR